MGMLVSLAIVFFVFSQFSIEYARAQFSDGDGVNGTGQPTANTGQTGGGVGGNTTGGGVGGNTTGGGVGGNTTGGNRVMSLINPIKCSPAAEQKGECLIEFLLAIISVLLLFALPIIIFFIMYAGFQFVTAAGNESKVSAAKSTLLWAVIGGVIILGSKLIITVIQGTITAFGQ